MIYFYREKKYLMKKSHYPQKYTDSYGIVHEFQKNNSQPEKNHIDFKNFKKGDKVVITFDEGGKEKNLFVKITSISLDKKVIHFETDDFEYECRFSEIKEITKPNKMNVVFWIYSAIVPLLCICICP